MDWWETVCNPTFHDSWLHMYIYIHTHIPWHITCKYPIQSPSWMPKFTMAHMSIGWSARNSIMDFPPKYAGFLQQGCPSHHPFYWGFPWNKPSICGPKIQETPIFSHEPYWTIPLKWIILGVPPCIGTNHAPLHFTSGSLFTCGKWMIWGYSYFRTPPYGLLHFLKKTLPFIEQSH